MGASRPASQNGFLVLASEYWIDIDTVYSALSNRVSSIVNLFSQKYYLLLPQTTYIKTP
jgi:TRAP-type mannitol/chloroaromatic compound transport system permease small subunit